MSDIFPADKGEAEAMVARLDELLNRLLQIDFSVFSQKENEEKTASSQQPSLENISPEKYTPEKAAPTTASNDSLQKIRQGLQESNYLTIASATENLSLNERKTLFNDLDKAEQKQVEALRQESLEGWERIVNEAIENQNFEALARNAPYFPRSVQEEVYRGLAPEHRQELSDLKQLYQSYINNLPGFEIVPDEQAKAAEAGGDLGQGENVLQFHEPSSPQKKSGVERQSLAPSVINHSSEQHQAPKTSPAPSASSASPTLPVSNTVGGVERVAASLSALPETEIKSLLGAQMQEMRQMISTLHTQSQQLQLQQQQVSVFWEQVNQQQSEYSSLEQNTAAVFPGRERNSTGSWIGSVSKTITQGWDKLVQREKNHDAASALLSLYHSQVEPSKLEYHAEDYIIARSGRSYTLKDKHQNVLMQWSSTPMGAKVQSVSDTFKEHYQHIEHLREQQKYNRLHGTTDMAGAFAPAGGRQGNYLTRVEAISKELVQHAQHLGSPIKSASSGLEYRWMATPDGKVAIERQRPGSSNSTRLYTQANGESFSFMEERDLLALERIVGELRRSRSSDRPQAAIPQHKQQPREAVLQHGASNPSRAGFGKGIDQGR